VSVERSLQALVERDPETFLGVTFLASEYSAGKTHDGRIDTLAIDEDDCPVIIAYRRSTNESVINRGDSNARDMSGLLPGHPPISD
jgi:hypothetical protein